MYFCKHKGGNIPKKRSSEDIKVNLKDFLFQKYSRTLLGLLQAPRFVCGVVTLGWCPHNGESAGALAELPSPICRGTVGGHWGDSGTPSIDQLIDVRPHQDLSSAPPH